MPRSPIFIIGCQRSGTTLLRLLLNAHPRIAIPEEGTFWMPLIKKYEDKIHSKIEGNRLNYYLKYIQNSSQFHLWGPESSEYVNRVKKNHSYTLSELMSEFYCYYAKLHKKDIWGDKTPSFFRMVPVLSTLFPTALFIHLIRDGRDVYLSWRKMKFQKRNISVSALEWAHKIKTIRKGLDSLEPERYIEIRYEDLVEKTTDILGEICNFIQLEYEPDMLDFWKTSKRFIGSHHSELIFQQVSSNSVEKWKTRLSPKEVKRFETIAGSTLVSSGYELSHDGSLDHSVHIFLFLELASGLLPRMWRVARTAVSLNLASRFGFTTDTVGNTAPLSKKLDKK